MSVDDMYSAEYVAAEKARIAQREESEQPPKLVITTDDQRRGADHVLSLIKQATENATPFEMQHRESAGQKALREWCSDPSLPTIARDDRRAITRNLDKIVRGEIRVL